MFALSRITHKAIGIFPCKYGLKNTNEMRINQVNTRMHDSRRTSGEIRIKKRRSKKLKVVGQSCRKLAYKCEISSVTSS